LVCNFSWANRLLLDNYQQIPVANVIKSAINSKKTTKISADLSLGINPPESKAAGIYMCQFPFQGKYFSIRPLQCLGYFQFRILSGRQPFSFGNCLRVNPPSSPIQICLAELFLEIFLPDFSLNYQS